MSATEPPNVSEIGPAVPTRRRVTVSIVFIAIALLFVAGGALLRASAPTPEDLETVAAEAPGLRVMSMHTEVVRPRVELSGLLEARRQVELFAEVPGRVLEVGAEELDRVEAGQMLFRMDPLLAEVAVKRARASIARAASEGTYAASNLDRNQGLAGRNVASRSALDQAENASRLAEAARLDAFAARDEAEDQLAKKVVTAPFAGVLRAFPVERDEYIQAGERVGELLDVSYLRIALGLSDRQIVAIQKGTEVELVVAARPGERFIGRVLRVGAAMDTNTRKFPIEIEIDNEAGRLLPGMVARVELTLGDERNRMTVPLDAMLDEYGLKHVFVVEANTTPEAEAYVARKRRVEVREIPFDPTQQEVVAGLSEGEWIATERVRQIRDGMPVRPIREPDRLGRAAGSE